MDTRRGRRQSSSSDTVVFVARVSNATAISSYVALLGHELPLLQLRYLSSACRGPETAPTVASEQSSADIVLRHGRSVPFWFHRPLSSTLYGLVISRQVCRGETAGSPGTPGNDGALLGTGSEPTAFFGEAIGTAASWLSNDIRRTLSVCGPVCHFFECLGDLISVGASHWS